MKVFFTTLAQIPAPGILSMSIRLDGIWHDMKDDGEGNLVSSKADAPRGTLCYQTGRVTLPAAPDEGSYVLFNLGV